MWKDSDPFSSKSMNYIVITVKWLIVSINLMNDFNRESIAFDTYLSLATECVKRSFTQIAEWCEKPK